MKVQCQKRQPKLSGIGRLPHVLSLEVALFAIGLFVYAATRLWALEQYPIYFFTDEAIHSVQADQLITNGMRDFQGTLFPAYFQNGPYWNLSLSVYIHAITVYLFGKSIFIARSTSVLIGMVGVVGIALTLKLVFKNRFWWMSVLILAVTPAWFLHSRTAFEAVMMVGFYACFLLFYLLYRTRSPFYLFPALLFGAGTFYAYTNGQAIMVVTGLLLLVADTRYHLRHGWIALAGLVVIILLGLPYVRFQLSHPDAFQMQLRLLDSYWLKSLPWTEKIVCFWNTYLHGLSPKYWFFVNSHDLLRHLMKGYPHIRTEFFPFVIVGLVLSLWHFHSARHRTILFALLATPVGAATVDIGITRVLAFIVPATLLACLGFDWLLVRVKWQTITRGLALALFGLLSFMALSMLRDALVNGPIWFRDYGLYGMQWGARPLFTDIIPEYLKRDLQTHIMVSPTWANGSEVFPRFFIPRQDWPRVRMVNVDYFLLDKQPLDANMVHIMPDYEYERACKNSKIKTVAAERVLNYPDGKPGFYFVRLAYSDDADFIFAQEREARRQLVEAKITIGGQVLQVRHSLLDMGEAKHMFDGDRFTLARVMEANPAIIEILFPKPSKISGLTGDFGKMDFTWTLKLYPPGVETPIIYEKIYRNLPGEPHVGGEFNGEPVLVSKMRLEIKDLNSGEGAKIHIRELTLW